MMAEIVNLRRVKKAKLRQEEETKAAEKRARFGTPPKLRKGVKAEKTRAERALDAHRIDRSGRSPLKS